MPHPLQSAALRQPETPDHRAGYRRTLSAYRDELRAEVERRWGAEQQEPETICRHALLPAGKLVRPLLCLESTAAVGGTAAQVMPAALGIEAGHVASLIHDDIIDGDDTRRGRPAVQHRFGIDRAILAGDRMIFSMFQGLAECQDRGVPTERIVQALRVFADMGADLCRGATVELALGGDPSCTVEDYLAMTRLKTAAGIRGACQIGAVLGGGTPEEVHALGVYGDELGTAFQIQDDLLPYDHDRSPTGKPATSDLRNRRPTLPILLAHRTASPGDRDTVEQMLAGRLDTHTAHRRIHEVVHRTGAMAAAHRIAQRHLHRARAALTALPATGSRTRLTLLADDVLGSGR
ncbi:polyprenyl synthetase family protein [Streptomyces sp. 1331.2]|uniref:polyprenyl synthetase family protein n=1 Tax=Streptomyces sp. 1331.2 TaxID=1938835 RepID=UPI000BC72E3A|nr:polyprenyl synthetase family protein [Streptomyces sp. 1331.2]SOB89072.1 geranylgeranyl diphosphate synthase, type I [Streptomyces sp. 1331.2]